MQIPADYINYSEKFIKTWAYNATMREDYDILGLFTGNQKGKTGDIAHQYVARILGAHPIPRKNVVYLECLSRQYKKCDECGWVGPEKETKKGRCPKCQSENSLDKNKAPHGYNDIKYMDVQSRGYENGTWIIHHKPDKMVCPYCGLPVVFHERDSRVFRFAAEKLPTDSGTAGVEGHSSEVSNSVYPEFKMWLPDSIIKRDKSGKRMDITIRRPVITLIDLYTGLKLGDEPRQTYKGGDILVEFVSYSGTVQSQAGIKRISVWMDESAPFDFFMEQLPRVFKEDGDIVITLTPAIAMSWEFDEIFEKGRKYIRTQAICDYYKKCENSDKKRVELTDSPNNIVILQAATDDNPTLSRREIEEKYANMPDPDGTMIATRRYGIFKHATGRVFKDMTERVHVISPEKYNITLDRMDSWTLGRAIDYHDGNPWAIMWAAISPMDECFVWAEWYPSLDRWITRSICERMGEISGTNQRYALNIIDPLAAKIQTNTGTSTLDDINELFFQLKKLGACTGGMWETWNTKGIVGRDAIKERLRNSIKCERPFSNRKTTKYGNQTFIPTIWFIDNCHETIRSIKHWRYETWANNRQLTTKEKKDTTQQRYSHFCMCLEALFKDKRFRAKKARASHEMNYGSQYYKAA